MRDDLFTSIPNQQNAVFRSRGYTPDRLRSLSNAPADDDIMEDILPKPTASHLSSSPTLVPSDGSLLDYFDLPSPPSTPHRPTHSLSYSSLSSASFPSPPSSHRPARSPGSLSLSSSSSAGTGSPPLLSGSSSSTTTTTPPFRWPTLSQRIHTRRLPTRSRSRSTTSSSALSDLSSIKTTTNTLLNADADVDVEMGGLGPGTGTFSTAGGGGGLPLLVRPARRTPYYPPNASRNGERARVYMTRGPHHVPNWTPLGSLPRHVQLQIEERMVKFTAI
ncbi:hypothetical protein L209DRAFT_802883 [Thermothelomyces heterothallicus CBS 203.75]